MHAALTVLLRLDSRNLQSWCPPVGSAAPSWILTRTPGEQPNSSKLGTVITAPEWGGCDSKYLPVRNLRYRGHISPSLYAKFNVNMRRQVTCLLLYTGRIVAKPQNTIQQPSSSTRLMTRIHLCWLGSRAAPGSSIGAFLSVPYELMTTLLCHGKKTTQALLLLLRKHLMIIKWHIRPSLPV